MNVRSALKLGAAAWEDAGWRAPKPLADFGRLVALHRTSRNRTITAVPSRLRPSSQMPPPQMQTGRPIGDVVVPVYNNHDDTVDLLAALAADDTFDGRIILVHDCSTDERLGPLVRRFAANFERATLLENAVNLGFVGTCNRGLSESGRDVVILNTDIVIQPGTVARLLWRLQVRHDIATVTPFSSGAYGVGLPHLFNPNERPFGATSAQIDAALCDLPALSDIELATGSGFCLGISARSLRSLGGFDAAFGKGYGEETDYCQRATSIGLRNLLAPDAYVEHKVGKSFGGSWQDKSRRGLMMAIARHPGYVARLSAYVSRGESRAVIFAGLVALAERLSGTAARVIETDERRIEFTPEPLVVMTRKADFLAVEIRYRSDVHPFRFANRELLETALDIVLRS